jgi:hypothetical protein
LNERTTIVATQPVLDLMRSLEEPKRKQWTPVFGAEGVQTWTYPNTITRSGDTVTFDGVTYAALDLAPGGDAEANTAWFIESPTRTVFLGDLVFKGTRSYVADGYLVEWLANLAVSNASGAGMDTGRRGRRLRSSHNNGNTCWRLHPT